jgi:transposase
MLQLFGSDNPDVPNSDIRSTPMNMQPQFETTREVTAISKILTDLVRTLELIESDIAAEEERAKISDRSHARHPMLARSLIERRDNITMTIAALEQRLTEQAATAA